MLGFGDRSEKVFKCKKNEHQEEQPLVEGAWAVPAGHYPPLPSLYD